MPTPLAAAAQRHAAGQAAGTDAAAAVAAAGDAVMADVVVTCPKGKWSEWIAEGDLPGGAATGDEYGFWLAGPRPNVQPWDRVYVVAHGKLRGWAPLVRIDPSPGGFALIRAGGAVACTIGAPITGFRGWRYAWWSRDDEHPFPDWRTP